MTLVMYVAVIALMATGLFFGIRYFVRAYIRYRDSRLIICPGNSEAAIVEVDAVHAALTSAFGPPDIRLQNCWRWPIHEACGQECLIQLDVGPAECLVRGVLMRWYQFKRRREPGTLPGQRRAGSGIPGSRPHESASASSFAGECPAGQTPRSTRHALRQPRRWPPHC